MMLRMSFTSIFHIKETSDISIDILFKLIINKIVKPSTSLNTMIKSLQLILGPRSSYIPYHDP